MKHRLCLVGQSPVVAIAREVAASFAGKARFSYIEGLMEDALPRLREVEDSVHIVLAGPSTRRMYAGQLKVPVIAFQPTFPDLIRAVLEARELGGRAAVCLSRDDRDLDLDLISRVTGVELHPAFCDTSREYAEGCRAAKERGLRVVIGGSFTVSAATALGLRGILLFKGRDMIRTAIGKALEICEARRDAARRLSQLTTVVNNFGEGLLLTDERGRVLLENPPARERLGAESLRGRRAGDLFGSAVADRVLATGERAENVIEGESLVVNYVPLGGAGRIHGLMATFRRVAELQDAEVAVRRRLHARGFLARYGLSDIVGESEGLEECRRLARLYAGAAEPVLVTGESGTGKELFAHAIHALSPRRAGPFVAINCATIPAELLESELFGYEKGAFTGARAAGKKGLIELAHGGTLFLDEITTLGWPLQAKLLRLLSEREILKLGSDRILPVDVRIVAATNVDVEAAVAERLFREDLAFRLGVFRLHIPPLRGRADDIAPLFLHFLSRIRPGMDEKTRGALLAAARALRGLPLRGNAREVENIARRVGLFLGEGPTSADAAAEVLALSVAQPGKPGAGAAPRRLGPGLAEAERAMIEEALAAHGTRAGAARALGVSTATLWRKMRRLGLSGKA